MAFLVTCEHGNHQIPDWVAAQLFANQTVVAEESYDVGALDAAKQLSRILRCPLIASAFSPAIIDVNRSIGNRGVFPAATRSFSRAQKQRLIAEIHAPYRKNVAQAVQRLVKKDGIVIHLSVHSFATFSPTEVVPEGEDRALSARRTDLGLLYDPSRLFELALCLDWYDDLYDAMPMLRVRRNYPRRGNSESLIRNLREKYAQDTYIGVELQLNRAWCGRDLPVREKVFGGIPKSLLRLFEAAREADSIREADAA